MDNHWSEDRVADILFDMRGRGITIWCEKDKLRYQANSGVFTLEDKKKLLSRKSEIISFLKGSPTKGQIAAPLLPRSSRGLVPLTPFQRFVWRNWSGPDSVRSIVAMRIIGRIDFELLRRSFRELVSRHESLRTGIVFVSGEPQQEIKEVPTTVLQSVGLTKVSRQERERQAKELVERLASERIDFFRDLLFDAKVIELDDLNSILIMRIHDLISDQSSRRILWRDIWKIYISYKRGSPASLPKILQPGDLAVWHERSEPQWARQHGEYWKSRLAGAERIYLFSTKEVAKGEGEDVPYKYLEWDLGEDLSKDLRALSRQEQTSLGMVVLTTWVALVMRWCGKSDVVFSFITTGRIHVETENAIGSFMCPVFLRIQLQPSDTFHDLLMRVVKEYDSAYQNHDFGRLIAQTPETDFSRNPTVNWGPKGFYQDPMDALNDANKDGVAGNVSVKQFEFTQPVLPDSNKSTWEPWFSFLEFDNNIKGTIVYSALLSARSCERFSRNHRLFAESMARGPHARVLEVSCI